MAQPNPSLRAIIVGAGPVGLYLAHAVSRAHVDCIVLEQHDTVLRDQGAGILLYPQTLRLLDQIGLYEKAEKDLMVSHTMKDLLTGNGRVIKSTPLWSRLQEQHTYPMAVLSRAQLIALLYENLPDKARVRTDAAVVDIQTHDQGVQVHLEDGSTEEGTVLLGADGVHSKTRRILQQLGQTPPDSWPMTATYQGLYGCFRPCLGYEPGTFYQSRGSGIVSQIMIGATRGHFALVRARSSPATESTRYTADDRDQLAEELTDIMVGPGVRFGDVWAATDKATAAMVDQEEGYCDKWYHERIVLAGDAVHKSTSVTGLGVNTGINSAAVLANELHQALRSEPNPDTAAFEDAFARYQQIRRFETSRLHANGRRQVRGVTWATWTDWLWDRFVSPWIGVETVAALFSKLIVRGQVLDYVSFQDREVRVPWKNRPPSRDGP